MEQIEKLLSIAEERYNDGMMYLQLYKDGSGCLYNSFDRVMYNFEDLEDLRKYLNN